MKKDSIFYCNNCGYESPKWLGCCPACSQWNTFIEAPRPAKNNKSRSHQGLLTSSDHSPMKISEIDSTQQPRFLMPSSELNRVLGGGLVKGSLILLGGDPGIGKSTLLLQNILSIRSMDVLYVSGEESATQLKLRADRIGRLADNVFILCETSLENILEQAAKMKPGLLVVDSIQTISTTDMESAAGSVGQVRECAVRLLRYAKETGTPVILVGHITKDGTLAGPKVLEHIVDTVLQFEGDRQNLYRLLRPVKNRFGSTNETGIYEMVSQGLREVKNPSEMLLTPDRMESMSGISIGVTAEGSRPLLVEVQALVSTAAYGTPQRSVIGSDRSRLNMLLAVLERRAKFKLGIKDVFLNIAGGLKVDDPALDAAVIAAVMSSNFDIPISYDTAIIGEVGLSGEIRAVSRIDQRIAEACRLGFSKLIVPKGSLKGIKIPTSTEIFEVGKVEDLLRNLFA